MAFIVIAHYRARPGAEQQVRAALAQMVAPTRAEPANLAYEVATDPADPAVFALFEKYTDAGAFTAHTETPHFQKYLRGEVLPNLSHRTRHDLTDLSGTPHGRASNAHGCQGSGRRRQQHGPAGAVASSGDEASAPPQQAGPSCSP